MAEKPPAERDSLKDDAKRVGRQAGKSVGSWDYSRPKYPHNIHPVLVPGISLDEQRRRYSIDKIVFGVAGLLTVAFVILGLVSPENVGTVADAAYTWVTSNLSWLFSAVATIVLFSLLALAFTRYGKIPLGKDGDKPEFSTFSWVAMLFAAGLGIGVMFWGPAEPLTYFITPPPLTNAPESTEAMQIALAHTYYNWGVHACALSASMSA